MNDGQGGYWEESGTPGGIPLLYLHGGPGGTLAHRSYATSADPDRFRVVGFEQRGCDPSVPLASDPRHDLEANTTARLIADIEELRLFLGVDRWVLNGVSWGSTLAIAYAQAHPERVGAVVVMAVTTTSRSEVDWITETVGTIFPEEWELFVQRAEDALAGYRRGGEVRLVEAYRVAAACRLGRRDSSAKGITVTTVRRYLHFADAKGGASCPPQALWVQQASPLTGRLGDDLCGEPRHLTEADVYDLDGRNGTNVGWATIREPEIFADEADRGRGLAHELGHVLFLAHGNGRDDENGAPVDENGPRRFDAFCDPAGTNSSRAPVEDTATGFVDCATSPSPMKPHRQLCESDHASG